MSDFALNLCRSATSAATPWDASTKRRAPRRSRAS